MHKPKAPLTARPTVSAKVITVIETVSVIGSGTPEDPLRHMIRYWNLEGELLAERDTIHDTTQEGVAHDTQQAPDN